MMDLPLFRLVFQETRQRLWWVIPPLLILALCLISPNVVPSDLRESWAGTAITQFAWSGAWLFALPGMLIEAARLGTAHRQRFQHLFWRGAGLSAPAHLFALALPILLLGSLSVLVAASFSYFFGYHTMMAPWPWFLIHLQAAIFFLTVALGLICLSLGVAIEVSSAGALTLASFILFAGQWLTLGLDEVRVRSEGDFRIVLEIISFCLPQYRFADLTDRIVYQWGALTFSTFFILSSYFLLWSLLLILTVWQNFQPHRQKHRKATFSAIAVAAIGILLLSNLVLWNAPAQLSTWRQQEAGLGFNPLSAKETGVGEVITDILMRQIDVSWHGGGQTWSHYLAKASLCDFLARRYRELTTHPFSPTRAELFHNRERSEALVRLAFDLSPSNVQAYQAYFHLLSLPSLTGEMAPPSGDLDTLENTTTFIPRPPSEQANQEMRRISYLALKNTDLTAPQQCLAAAWIWFNLLNITPKFQVEERQELARHMLDTLKKADAAWTAGRPVPAGYDFKRNRTFLGKLATSAIKDAKE